MHPDTWEKERQEALSTAKLAVRAYAREPSEANAADVDSAYSHLRRISERAVAERRARQTRAT